MNSLYGINSQLLPEGRTWDDDPLLGSAEYRRTLFIERNSQLEYFGWDLKYDYNAHLSGPFSTKLSIHYNTIGSSTRSNITGFTPSVKNQANFIYYFSDKDERWLEIASTCINIKETREYVDFIDYVVWLKPKFLAKEITTVDNDLKNSPFFEYT